MSQGSLKSVDYYTCNCARSVKNCWFEKIAFEVFEKNKQYIFRNLPTSQANLLSLLYSAAFSAYSSFLSFLEELVLSI